MADKVIKLNVVLAKLKQFKKELTEDTRNTPKKLIYAPTVNRMIDELIRYCKQNTSNY